MWEQQTYTLQHPVNHVTFLKMITQRSAWANWARNKNEEGRNKEDGLQRKGVKK